MKISFGIKTHLKQEDRVLGVIANIHHQGQKLDDYEILITGNTNFSDLGTRLSRKLRLLPDKEAAANGLLGKMLNTLAKEARYENICLIDDDIILTDSWIENLLNFLNSNPSSDILCFPIKNPDGSRFWDWAQVNTHTDSSELLPYWDKQALSYATGGMIYLRRHVWEIVKWDSSRGFYQREDVDWSMRAHAAGFKIALCPFAYVLHNDGRYSQQLDRVLRAGSTVQESGSWLSLLEHEALWPRSNESAPQRPPTSFKSNAFSEFITRDVAQVAPNTKPVIVWVGRFSGPAVGYSIASKSYLRAMIDTDIPVIAFDFNLMKIVGPARGIELEVQETRSQVAISIKDPALYPVVVVHETPDHFGKVQTLGAAYRIGYCVFETESFPAAWLSRMKEMDKIWTASSFNKRTFTDGGIDQKKIHLLPHCFVEDDFLNVQDIKIPHAKDFCFFSVVSNYNRKDIGLLLRAYFQAFSSSDPVSLVIKSAPDLRRAYYRKFVVEALKPEYDLERGGENLPHVIFLDNEMTYERLIRLYKFCDVCVSLDRGKGWDLTAMEAMALKKPVIGIDYGGSQDFMSADRSYLLSPLNQKEFVDPLLTSTEDLYAGQIWPRANEKDLVQILRQAFENADLRHEKGIKSKDFVWSNFSHKTIGRSIKSILDQFEAFPENSPAGRVYIQKLPKTTTTSQRLKSIAKKVLVSIKSRSGI